MADETEAKEEAPVVVKSGGGLGMIVGLINLIATFGLAAFIILDLGGSAKSAPANMSDAGPPVQEASGEEEPGPLVKLDDFVVQLRNPEFDRYVRVSFQVEVSDKEHIVAVEGHEPMIRDRFIKYFSDRSYEELRGSRGLERAKRELLQITKSITPDDSVRSLLITNFVVQ